MNIRPPPPNYRAGGATAASAAAVVTVAAAVNVAVSVAAAAVVVVAVAAVVAVAVVSVAAAAVVAVVELTKLIEKSTRHCCVDGSISYNTFQTAIKRDFYLFSLGVRRLLSTFQIVFAPTWPLISSCFEGYLR